VTDRKPASRISNAEIKAGVFLTFCLALFVAMLFVLGKFGRTWRGRQEVNIAFTQVNGLRPDAPVLYDGMDVGHVKQIKIMRLNDEALKKLPPFTKRDLPNLPITDPEEEHLQRAADDEVDAAVRKLIFDRNMVVLTLDMLSENDTQRFRADDEYRIAGSLIGDSFLEIRTGAGPALSPAHDKYILGVGGDMYTDLGASISQVKDILQSMAEMVGGDAGRKTIQEQLSSFENFTGRMESMSDSMVTKLPGMWDDIDGRLDNAGKMMADVEVRVEKMKPELIENLDSATKAIAELQERTGTSVTDAYHRIANYRKDINEGLAEWKKLAADYRETIPDQVHAAREWSDRFAPTADKIDMFFMRADEQLNKGVDSTRAGLKELADTASSLEEVTYRLKRWPWDMSGRSEENVLRQQMAEWQKDLAKRQYQELRNELDRVKQSLSNSDARVGRIDQLIRESDTFFDVSTRSAPPATPAATPPPKKGGK
jgi:ABC-type transporter Mla subunit MlaD